MITVMTNKKIFYMDIKYIVDRGELVYIHTTDNKVIHALDSLSDIHMSLGERFVKFGNIIINGNVGYLKIIDNSWHIMPGKIDIGVSDITEIPDSWIKSGYYMFPKNFKYVVNRGGEVNICTSRNEFPNILGSSSDLHISPGETFTKFGNIIINNDVVQYLKMINHSWYIMPGRINIPDVTEIPDSWIKIDEHIVRCDDIRVIYFVGGNTTIVTAHFSFAFSECFCCVEQYKPKGLYYIHYQKEFAAWIYPSTIVGRRDGKIVLDSILISTNSDANQILHELWKQLK